MLKTTTRLSLVALAAIWQFGCDKPPAPAQTAATATQRVTITIQGMGERLNLL